MLPLHISQVFLYGPVHIPSRLCQDSPAKLVLVRCQFQNLHHLGYLFLMSGLLGDLMVPFGAWDCEFFQIIYLMGVKRVFLLDFFNWHIVNQGKAFKSVARAHRMPDFIRTDHRAVQGINLVRIAFLEGLKTIAFQTLPIPLGQALIFPLITWYLHLHPL